MVTAQIKINGVAGSSDSLSTGVPAVLTNSDNTGVTSWSWQLVSKPPGSGSTMVTPSSPSASFTPDVVGSYLVGITIMGGSSSDTDETIGAVLTPNLGIRIPASREESEFDSIQGWGGALYDAMFALDAAEAATHAIGGTKHTISTLAQLNTKISDATLDKNTDTRPPIVHGLTSSYHSNISFLDAYLTFVDIDGYALKTDIDGYALQSSVDLKADKTVLDAYLTFLDIDSYAKKELLDAYQIVGPYITFTDIDGYALQSAVDLKADKTVLDAYLTFLDIDGYALQSAVDLKADKTVLDAYLIFADIDGYAKKELLDAYQASGPYLTYTSIDAYALTADVNVSLNLKADLTLLDSYAVLTDFNDHSTRHESGGGDAIKLDDLAAPDNNTNLDATTLVHGLLPKLSGNITEFLNGTGGFSIPAGGGGGADSYQVLISANDTTPGYLEDKLVGTGLVTISTLNEGDDEDLQIAVNLDGYQASGPFITFTDIDGYAKKELLDAYQVAGPYITFTDIDGYALQSSVDLKADLTLLDSYQMVGPYITFTDIDGYAKKELLDSYQVVGPYITFTDIDGYALQSSVDLKADKSTLDAYLTFSDIDGYATITLLETPGSQIVFVDKNRTDTYTADGTPIKPYKTISAALTAITDNDADNRYCINIASGTYVEQITCKPYIDLLGASRSSVIISCSTAAYTVQGTAAIASGGTRIDRLTINNTWGTGGYAVSLSGAGILLISDCSVYSSNAHAIYSDTGNITVHDSRVVSGTNDAFRGITSGQINLEQTYFEGGGGSGDYDIYTGSGTYLYLDGAVQIWNWDWSFNGSWYTNSTSDFIGNDSSVSGGTVSQALNNLKWYLTVWSQSSTPVNLEYYNGRTIQTNEGASAQIQFNLPAADYGLTFTFVVQDSDGIKVVAEAGDTIRIAASVSASGGYIAAATVGNVITLTGINETEWIATSYVGTWTIDS